MQSEESLGFWLLVEQKKQLDKKQESRRLINQVAEW